MGTRKTRSRSRQRSRSRKWDSNTKSKQKYKRSQSKPPSLRSRSHSRKKKRTMKQKSKRRNSAQTLIPSPFRLSRSFDTNTKSVKTSIQLTDGYASDNGNRSKSYDPNTKVIRNKPPVLKPKSNSFSGKLQSEMQYENAPVPKGFKQRKRSQPNASAFKFAIQTEVFDEFLMENAYVDNDEKIYFVNSPVLGADTPL